MDLNLLIAGVDEVGRGPLAGPVVAAAVILDPKQAIIGLADSKKLSEKKREQLALEIKSKALAWALGRAEMHEIDELNIFHASLLAMQRAVMALPIVPQEVWVDGKFCPNLTMPCTAIIKGDATVPSISAASIIAKVTRDAEMCAWELTYPGYGFAQHKGYPTKAHLLALEKLGVTGLHRQSFAPVRQLLQVNS